MGDDPPCFTAALLRYQSLTPFPLTIWVAIYNGGCAARYTPDGKLDRKIDVPAKAVTSLCFGGPDRRDLYVVTADNTEDPERKGTIFRTRIDVPGLPAPLARV